MSKGILVVVSGFSGAGKGTVMKRLLEKYNDYALSISVTTRNPRPGEEDGREYFFRTKEEFEKLIKEDALIEYAQYVENYYGTPRSYVEEQLQAGKNVILEIEIQGAMKVKEKIPEALLVFVTPPTVESSQQNIPVHPEIQNLSQIFRNRPKHFRNNPQIFLRMDLLYRYDLRSEIKSNF